MSNGQRESDEQARFRGDFRTLTGNSPFPWQERLFGLFCAGDLPSALDLPTGLGKTSVMAIWLLARAHAGETVRKKIPRRLVYVVDRRAVVDQATAEAEKIRENLERAPSLRLSLRLEGKRRLPISTLRGKYVDNRDWLADPTAPAIIVGTVDMIGSRLLFSGYGVSSKMRPYHAGFLGADTLVVLDEAHLVPPFEALIRKIATNEFGPRAAEDKKMMPCFHLMSLSATGRTSEQAGGEGIFRLSSEDYDDEIVKTRLGASKSLIIETVTESKALVGELAKRAWRLGTEPRAGRILVYCDSRQSALDVKKTIEGLAKRTAIKSELLVGARRAYERENLFEWLRDQGFVGKPKEGGEDNATVPRMPTFLVATSAGEVGVDLDADHMVCDLVEWERMVQRFGRLNRRGGKQSIIEVVAAPPKTKKKEEEEWEKRLARLRAPLDMLERDASPGAIIGLKDRGEKDLYLGARITAASTSPPLRPVLSRALLDAWSMTSLEKHMGRPDIQPWLRGWIVDERQTQIIWRKHLPIRAGATAPTAEKDIDGYFEAAPPHVSEVLEIETSAACEWLITRAQAVLKAKEQRIEDHPAPSAKTVVAMVLDRKDEVVLNPLTCGELARLGEKENARSKEEFGRILAGKTLVILAELGGLHADGMLDGDEKRAPHTIDDGLQWLSVDERGVPIIRFRARTVGTLGETDRDWRRIYAFATRLSENDETGEWLIVEQWRGAAQQEDGRAIERANQTLKDHRKRAENGMRKIAAEFGLEPSYASALAIAALLHDEGKASWRWQRAFSAPRDDIYAKTRGPLNAKLLDGYRHEFTSLWAVRQDPAFKQLDFELQDLVLHLVAAHHGFARPVISTSNCEEAGREDVAREAAFRFARQLKRWGPWGLAWWEALLRAADQQASRESGESEVEEPDANPAMDADEEAA
ncbi:MAG: type I-U CRISPR-associated helicase/endonuclease Cas3 [Parvibaculaceae bacterium]